MTDDEMRQLVDDILDTQLEYHKFVVDKPERTMPAGPATTGDLAALQAHAHARGYRLPPSFRQFLSLFNGIERFRRLDSLDLFSARQIVDNASEYDDEDDFEPVCHFVFGGGYATALLGFDPDSVDDEGEMAVVEFSSDGDATEHENFIEFLRFHLDLFNRLLAKEQADRADLADD